MVAERNRIRSVTSTELFVDGDDGMARQVIRVAVAGAPGRTCVTISGGTVYGSAVVSLTGDTDTVVEVPVDTGDLAAGSTATVEVAVVDRVDGDTMTADFVVAEPGWTLHLIPHFHFDPVWWNTQAASVSEWDRRTWSTAPQLTFQKSAMDVLHDHLRLAAVDTDYCFVVAEVDYLKPFRDHHPELRALLDRLIATGRVEVVGGTWNEPDLGLPAIETLRRNFRFGLAYQDDVLGARVTTGWNLDVFGHAPQYPAVAAEAGIRAVALARGPFHQWGLLRDGPFDAMTSTPRQHRSEVRWTSPGGAGVLLHSLPGHYTAGHQLDDAQTIEEAQAHVLEWLRVLGPHASGRTVVVPVGTDLAPPVRWVTEVARHFSERYRWPKVRCSVPSTAFDDIARTSGPVRTFTRDLNPIYTGKDVTYADIKAAHTAVENLLLDAETWAALAGRVVSERHRSAIDAAWRQLVWLSHHDAITGTCSDQVYLDLVAGWRSAHDQAMSVFTGAADALGAQLDLAVGPPGSSVPLLVLNVDAVDRPGLVTVSVDIAELGSPGVSLTDADGRVVPMVVEHAERDAVGNIVRATLTIASPSVPGVGHTVLWLLGDSTAPTWAAVPGDTISNRRCALRVDPDRGGAVVSLVDRVSGRELLADNGLGGVLAVDVEHQTHPSFGEGPWHLLPTGERETISDLPATVRREVSAIGERFIVEGPLPDSTGPHAWHRTTYLLAENAALVSVEHQLHGQVVDNRLIRVGWQVPVSAARPVCDVGEAVIGRGHGFARADSAVHPWTLDSSFATWFGLGSTARVVVDGEWRLAVGAVELVVPGTDDAVAAQADRLAAALARSGVTATITVDTDSRCGDLSVDSGGVDLRIALTDMDAGRPRNRLARDRLMDLGVAATGPGAWLAPADRPIEEVWVPGFDVTARGDLPLLVVAAPDVGSLAAVVDDIVCELDREHEIRCAAVSTRRAEVGLESYSVGFASTDVHSAVAEIDGTVWLNLRRSCTAWPAGQWLDPPRRTLPDGSTFAAQHWSHTARYSIAFGSGDWREAALDVAARHATRPLRARAIAGGGVRAATARLLTLQGGPHLGAVERTSDGDLCLRLVSLTSRTADSVISTEVDTDEGRLSDLRLRPGIALTRSERGWHAPVPPMSSIAVMLREKEFVLPTPVDGSSATGPRRPEFSRWWLQNTGPPAAGARGVSVQLRRAAAGFDVLVVSDLPHEVTVDLELSGPTGTFSDVAETVTVGPRGHVLLPVQTFGDCVTPTIVTALATPRGNGLTPTHDAIVLPPFTTADVLDLAGASEHLGILRPGDQAQMWVDLRWRGTVMVPADAVVVSPWGSWDIVSAPHRRVEVAPGRTRITLPIQVPPSSGVGRWWAMIVVRCLDQVLYGPPVWITVGDAKQKCW